MSAVGLGSRQSTAAAKPFPLPQYAWYALGVFFLAAVLSYTDRLILNLLVDPVRHDLHITDTQVSLLQGAAFAVLYALISLPLGRYVDSHNRRNIIAAGVVIWSLATAVCGIGSSFGGLFVARIFVGVGEATLAPAVMSLIPDYFPEHQRGTAYGFFLTGMAMGAGAAMLIGGALFEGFHSGRFSTVPLLGHMAPWRAVLIALSLPGCLVAGLILTVREPARRDTVRSSASVQAGGHFATTIRYFKDNRRTFSYLIAAFALLNLVSYGCAAWLPSVFIRHFGLTQGQVGTELGVVSLAGTAIGAILGGLLSDRVVRTGGAVAVLRFTLWSSAATLPLLVSSILPSITLVLVVYFAFLVVGCMVGTASITAIQAAVPGDMRGFSVAIQAFVYTLVGLGLGPTSMALATQYIYRDPRAVGWSMVAVAVPVTIVGTFLVWLALPHYKLTQGRLAAANGAGDE